MKRNQQQLMDLMYHHRLQASDVAELLNILPNTVRVWRCNGGMSMPDSKLELLQFKLEKRGEKD